MKSNCWIDKVTTVWVPVIGEKMKFDNNSDIIQLTPKWEGDRFDNGRPKVSDEILNRMENVATEEVWSILWEN